MVLLGGGCVSWHSRKQKRTALSTTEAEATAAAKDILWFRQLLVDVGFEQGDQTVLYSDNMSAIRLVRNPEFHQRTKHIEVQYQHIRELQENGTISLMHVRTQDQLADILTKPLDKSRFNTFRNQICLESSV